MYVIRLCMWYVIRLVLCDVGPNRSRIRLAIFHANLQSNPAEILISISVQILLKIILKFKVHRN